MKKILTTLCLVFATFQIFAQSSGINWKQYYISGSLAVGKKISSTTNPNAYPPSTAVFQMGQDTGVLGYIPARVLDTSSVATTPRWVGLTVFSLGDSTLWTWKGNGWYSQVQNQTNKTQNGGFKLSGTGTLTRLLTGSLIFTTGSFQANYSATTLTGNRADTLPDKDGTLMLTSDLRLGLSGTDFKNLVIGLPITQTITNRNDTGTLAMGYSDAALGSTITTDSRASIAFGDVSTRGFIDAIGKGTFAGGFAHDSAFIKANGAGSFVFGEAFQGNGSGMQTTHDASIIVAAVGAADATRNTQGTITLSGFYNNFFGGCFSGTVALTGVAARANGYAFGRNGSTVFMTSSGTASSVGGYLTNIGGGVASMLSGGSGSDVYGSVQIKGSMKASGPGSFIRGIIPNSGTDSCVIEATLNAGWAIGNAEQGGWIQSNGGASFAGGLANKGKIISGISTNHGSFAYGSIQDPNTVLIARGESSFCYGEATGADSLVAWDSVTVTFGMNVKNYGKYSFAYGKTFRNTNNKSFVVGWDNVKYFDLNSPAGLLTLTNVRFNIKSTTSGSSPWPNMTTTQRTGLTASESDAVYDTDLHKVFVWDGSVWQALW